MSLLSASIRVKCAWVASAAASRPAAAPAALKKELPMRRPSEEVVKESAALRKYWGGEEEDPLATDEFMWNKDFMGKMKKLVAAPAPVPSSITSEPAQGKESGFLSLSRASTLDSIEVDLSKELRLPVKPRVDAQSETTRQSGSFAPGAGRSEPRWKLAPTRREQEKWDQAAKFATGGSDVMLREVKKLHGDPQILAAKSRKQYLKLKNKLILLTLGIGCIRLVSAYISFSSETAVRTGGDYSKKMGYGPIRILILC